MSRTSDIHCPSDVHALDPVLLCLLSFPLFLETTQHCCSSYSFLKVFCLSCQFSSLLPICLHSLLSLISMLSMSLDCRPIALAFLHLRDSPFHLASSHPLTWHPVSMQLTFIPLLFPTYLHLARFYIHLLPALTTYHSVNLQTSQSMKITVWPHLSAVCHHSK